jgi:hypothetical protein
MVGPLPPQVGMDDDDNPRSPDPLDALASMFDADAGDLFPDLDGPLFWPALSASEAHVEWLSLRTWVEQLVHRFSIPTQVIPPCWFRHNALVEGLVALRDHHRASFSPTASPTSAMDGHRAFRDMEQRLAGWASQTQCTDRYHQPDAPRAISPHDTDWEDFVRDDTDRRSETAMAGSLVN